MPARRLTNARLPQRTIALCYVRLSYTKDETDTNSPDRQRANIQRICNEHGWTPEWYIDAEGHKSGTAEKNRPQWLALKTRIHDPQVASLVANDLSRLHRKLWHVGRTLDELDEAGVRLILAAPGRQIDTSTPHGRMLISFIAMQDEAYAADVGQRAKDSAQHRRSRGITLGLPPFGTVRPEKQFLAPSPEGVWLLSNGVHQAGLTRNEPPEANALWFGYYECARRILEIYAQNVSGYDKIARRMTKEGWRFRDRDGLPRLMNGDDIRRVTSNWREYAGLVGDGKAKEKNASQIEDPAALLYETGRAVFDLGLLRRVADVQKSRSFTVERAVGAKANVNDYALLRLVYCAHCERIAQQEDNPRRRSRLSGSFSHKPRYRHVPGTQCGCKSRSVQAPQIENDFIRLVGLFTIKEDLLAAMLELALETTPEVLSSDDLERQKSIEIAQLRRQFEALKTLFALGDIEEGLYLKRRDDIHRLIAHWEARTTDLYKKAFELTHCLTAFTELVQSWDDARGDQRLRLARGLFQYLVYDLDQQKIVDFRLHPWADQYLILRGELLTGDDDIGGNKNASPLSSDEATSDPNAIQNEPHSPTVSTFIQFLEHAAYPQRSALETLLTEPS